MKTVPMKYHISIDSASVLGGNGEKKKRKKLIHPIFRLLCEEMENVNELRCQTVSTKKAKKWSKIGGGLRRAYKLKSFK